MKNDDTKWKVFNRRHVLCRIKDFTHSLIILTFVLDTILHPTHPHTHSQVSLETTEKVLRLCLLFNFSCVQVSTLSVVFNKTCIKERLLPKYTYIYIYNVIVCGCVSSYADTCTITHIY